MAAILSEKAQQILVFLQKNSKSDFTSKDIAATLNLDGRSVTGVLNGLQRKGLIIREVVEGQKDKLIRITPEGLAMDPYAEKDAE